MSDTLAASTIAQAFSIRGFARFAHIGQARVRQLIRAGRLPVIDCGQPGKPCYRILPDALRALAVAPVPQAPKRTRRRRPAGFIERY